MPAPCSASTHDGEVARLTLDRPEARNAIPAAGWAALAGALGEVESGAGCWSSTGAGGAFCAGADLADFAAMRDDEARERPLSRGDARARSTRCARLPIPTIARIEGLATAPASRSPWPATSGSPAPAARFAITPAKIGISYPQEDVHRLVALVGPGQAARLLFTAASDRRRRGAADRPRRALAELRRA